MAIGIGSFRLGRAARTARERLGPQAGRGRSEGPGAAPLRTFDVPSSTQLSIDPAQIKLQEEIAEANARATALFAGQTGAFQASERGTILAGSAAQQARGATGGAEAAETLIGVKPDDPGVAAGKAILAGGPQAGRKITPPTEPELQEEVELTLLKKTPAKTVALRTGGGIRGGGGEGPGGGGPGGSGSGGRG